MIESIGLSVPITYHLGALGRIHNALHFKTAKLITVKVIEFGDISEKEFMERFTYLKSKVFKLKVRNMRISNDNNFRISQMIKSFASIDMSEIQASKDNTPENLIKYLYVDKKLEEREILIAEEYVPGGSIKNILNYYYTFKERLVRSYTFQILLGLND